MNRARLTEINVEITQLIADFCCLPENKIERDSDLFFDLGISGDDGVELLETIDKRYSIDWNDIHTGIHFGNEGLGFPFPWQLYNDGSIFERQPIYVSDLIHAVDTGKWKGTPRTLRPLLTRVIVYLLSTLQMIVLLGPFVLGTAFLIFKLRQQT